MYAIVTAYTVGVGLAGLLWELPPGLESLLLIVAFTAMGLVYRIATAGAIAVAIVVLCVLDLFIEPGPRSAELIAAGVTIALALPGIAWDVRRLRQSAG